MTSEKQNELTTHLLVCILSEMQMTRDLLFGYIGEQKGINDEQADYASKAFGKKVKDRQRAILAQIKLYYEGGFGSVDDLLSSL